MHQLMIKHRAKISKWLMVMAGLSGYTSYKKEGFGFHRSPLLYIFAIVFDCDIVIEVY